MDNILHFPDPKSLGSHFIHTSQTTRILAALNNCLNSKEVKGKADSMIIYGNPRAGKTRTIEYFIKSTSKNILYCEMPCPASIGALISQIRRDIGDPTYLNSKNVNEGTHKVFDLLKNNECDMLIIDECQHLIDSNRNKLIMDVADWIKRIINTLNISVVFVGLPYLKRIIENNKQLSHRILYVDTLDYYAINSDDFELLIYEFFTLTGFKLKESLVDDYIIERIHSLTDGKIGYVSQFFMEFVIEYKSSPHDTLNLLFFENMIDKRLYKWFESNPFSEKYDLVEYVQNSLISTTDEIYR